MKRVMQSANLSYFKNLPLRLFFGASLFSIFTASPEEASVLPTEIPPAFTTQELRQRANNRVFQIITRSKGAKEKRSYGSAYVVDASGLLVSNFHVVSSYVFGKGMLELEMVDPTGKNIDVQVVDFDIMNDLALLRVDKKFESTYTLGQNSRLSPGQKIYSIGLPQDTVMTMVEGLFSDLKQHGPVQRLYSSNPVNSGMSGGPVVNEFDQVIATNQAILKSAQNVSILIPVEPVQQLLERGRDLKAQFFEEAPSTKIHDQVSAELKPWIEDWKNNSQILQSTSFENYEILELPKNSQCWENHSKKDSVLNCSSGISVSVGEESSGGELNFTYILTKNGLVETSKPFESFDEQFVEASSRDADSEKFICHQRLVKNRQEVKLFAQYCVTRHASVSQLANLRLAFRVVDNREKTFMGYMSAMGVPMEQAIQITDTFINSVYFKGSKSNPPSPQANQIRSPSSEAPAEEANGS